MTLQLLYAGLSCWCSSLANIGLLLHLEKRGVSAKRGKAKPDCGSLWVGVVCIRVTDILAFRRIATDSFINVHRQSSRRPVRSDFPTQTFTYKYSP
jgi:hypothetical protein